MKPQIARTVLQFIKEGDNSNAIRLIYLHLRRFQYKLQYQYRLSEHDAEAAFDDAILALIKNVKSGRYEEKGANLSTYFYEVFRNKCIDLSRKQTNYEQKLAFEMPEWIPEKVQSRLELDEEKNTLMSYVKQMKGRNCTELLIDFYYNKFAVEALCEKYGYKNENTVTSKKNDCMKELKSIIKAHSLT
jgi:RNA polymerase sigma factor (sigma-70 family)